MPLGMFHFVTPGFIPVQTKPHNHMSTVGTVYDFLTISSPKNRPVPDHRNAF